MRFYHSMLMSTLMLLGVQTTAQAADAATTLGTLGQIAGAVYGAQASGSTTTSVSTSLPVPLYSQSQMVAMSCLDLELAASKLDRAIARSKSTATELYEQEKAAVNAPTSQQQQRMRSIATILGAVAQSRGGKAAEYAGIANQIGGLNTSHVSESLDVELDKLQKMNEQAADMAIIRRHKNCLAPATSTGTMATGAAVAAGTAGLAAGAALSPTSKSQTTTSTVAGTQTLTTTVTTKQNPAQTLTKKKTKVKKTKKAKKH